MKKKMTKDQMAAKVAAYCHLNEIWDLETAQKFRRDAKFMKRDKVKWWLDNMDNLKKS